MSIQQGPYHNHKRCREGQLNTSSLTDLILNSIKTDPLKKKAECQRKSFTRPFAHLDLQGMSAQIDRVLNSFSFSSKTHR